MKNIKPSRRDFIKKAAGTAIGAVAIPSALSASPRFVELSAPERPNRSFAANDQINVGMIGMGIMGFNNAATSSKIPGVKLVAACDLYSGRLDHCKEVHGNDLFVTKNYQELLDRKDIDAVIISTSDHWHDRITIEALNKGKHVYCEKPMVHKLEEGSDVISAYKKSGKVVQVGSQRLSSIITLKAAEIFASGIIGDLVLIETSNDRHSANGAWQYSIPTDAKTPGAVDWDRFQGDAPKMAYDPVRFFRWRNYQDYGTGVAGDLFVHLFTGVHAVTGSKGPSRAFATGGLRYWKDGRDVPDVITGVYDYSAQEKHPAFNLQMRVNFVDGSEKGETLQMTGTEGAIILGWGSVKVVRNKLRKAPGYGGWDSFDTFSEAQQKDYEKWYKEKYPPSKPEVIEPGMEYRAPERYSADYDHHNNFYTAIREGKMANEDPLFGMRAAGPALLANKSYYEKKVIHWDPEKAIVVQGV